MRSEQVNFAGSDGIELAGSLELPDDPPRAFALFAHCFTCSKDVFAASRISRELTEYGIAVLRFDFTGLGSSDGDFANTDFTSNVEDLVSAANYLRDNYSAPTILVGHSLGGAAVLAAAEHIPEARAVATIGAPASTEHVLGLLSESREEIETKGEAEVQLASRPFRIRKQFLDDISDQPQAARIGRLDSALMVMHSPLDERVGIENAQRIFVAARHPKSFIALDGADHLLTRPADSRFAASILAAWTDKYISDEDSAETEQTSTAGSDDGTVTVVENGNGPYGQDITVGHHLLHADEPTPVGHDTGPSPYDLLLAALGACTSMTLRMYAARKEWPLEHVTVALQHAKVHAKDCAEYETETGKIERIIEITGDLDDEQRQRLLEIADRCPVHRTLHSEVDVRSRLADENVSTSS